MERALAEPGQALDPESRGRFERGLGGDLGGVTVHEGPAAAAAAAGLGATAFTLGRKVVLGARTAAHGTRDRSHTLAHELTHVIQGGGAPARGPRSVEPAFSPVETEAQQLADRVASSPSSGLPAHPVKRVIAEGGHAIARQPAPTSQLGDENGVELGGTWDEYGQYWYFEEETGHTWVWLEPQKQWQMLATATDAVKITGVAPPAPKPPATPPAPTPVNPYQAWAAGIGTRYFARTGPFGIGALPVAHGAAFAFDKGSTVLGTLVHPAYLLAGPPARHARDQMNEILDTWTEEAKQRERELEDDQAEARGDLYRLPVSVIATDKPPPTVAMGTTKNVGPRSRIPARVEAFADSLKTTYRKAIVEAKRQNPKASASEVGRVAEKATLEQAEALAEANGLNPGHIWIGDFPVGVTGPAGGASTAEIGSQRYGFIIELKKSPRADRRPQTQAHETAVEESVNFDEGVRYYKLYGENYEGEGVKTVETGEQAEPVVEGVP